MNLKKIILSGLVIWFILFSCYLLADEKTPDQCRIVFHTSKILSQKIDLYLRFVFPNIVESRYPTVWFGPRKKFSEKFSLAFMLGKTFRKDNNTLKLSMFPIINIGKWFIWNEIDYNFTPRNVYSMTQIRYPVLKDLRIGLDNENIFSRTGFYSLGPAVDVKLTNNVLIASAYFLKWTDSQKSRRDFFRFYLIISL